MLLLAGSSNPSLSKSIATALGIKQITADISYFANGEKRVWIRDSVQGQNVVLVQSFSHPTDEHIMESLLMIDALERMGVRHINLVIPWMGYSLQDKVFRPGEPIAAKVVANLVSHAYVKRVFLFDLHNSSTPGFFSVPSHHITAHQLFADYVTNTIGLDNAVIASPDFGGLKRSRVFADSLGLELVNVDKHRDLHTGEVTALGVNGEVAGKNVVIYDDVINSGGTVIETTKFLKKEGAAGVYFLSAHAVFKPEAIAKLAESPINKIVITNSVAHESLPENIIQLDAAPLFANELRSWL